MSVFIRGMKKPKNCSRCRFYVDGWCYAQEANPREQVKDSWLNNCPLIAVSDPHGRLIDGDEVVSKLEFAVKLMPILGRSSDEVRAYQEILDGISNEPTVIDATQGWIDCTDYVGYPEPLYNFECSICGHHIFDIDTPPNICPNCKTKFNMKYFERG